MVKCNRFPRFSVLPHDRICKPYCALFEIVIAKLFGKAEIQKFFTMV